MQDWKTTDEGKEFAGLENYGLEFGGLEFGGLENDGFHQYGLTLCCLEYILLTNSAIPSISRLSL